MQTIKNFLTGIGAGVVIGAILWGVIRFTDYDGPVLITTGAVIGGIAGVTATILWRWQRKEPELSASAANVIDSSIGNTADTQVRDHGYLVNGLAMRFGYFHRLSAGDWMYLLPCINKSNRRGRGAIEAYVVF